jgi:hypothetical protein
LGTGAGMTNTWIDTILASADGIQGNADDVLLAQFPHTGFLQVGERYGRSETLLLPPAFQGRFHLFVRTDATAAVFENGSEANNVAEATQTFDAMPIPYADLTVTAVTAPTAGNSGQPLRISWSVQNQGLGATNTTSWIDRVSLARSPDGSNLIAALAEFTHNGSLNPGSAYSRTADVTLPNGVSGTVFIVVQTGIRGPFEFLYTANNTVVSDAVAVTLSPSPDLVVTDIPAPAAANSGAKIDISWTVRNDGEGDATSASWTDRVCLSLDTSLDNSDQLLGEFRHEDGILAKGDSYAASLNVSLPDGISGPFNILVFTDSNVTGSPPPADPGVRLKSRFVTDPVLARVGEFRDEGDNIATAPLTVFLTDPADLRVTSVQIPERATAGQSFTLTYTVANTGAAATPIHQQEWDDFFYLSRDGFLDLQADIFLGSERHHGMLEAGASYQLTHNLKLPRGLSGAFFVFAVTDPVRFADRPRGEVFEGPFEKNNATAAPVPLIITVPPADLVADTVSIPMTARSGEPLAVTWTVSNHGAFAAEGSWSDTAYLSEDAISDISDKPLGRVGHQGTLAPGESYNATLRTNLPPVTPGVYRVIVRPDIFDEIFEGPDEANNKTASIGSLRVTVDALPLDVPVQTTLSMGQDRLYQIAVGLGQTLRVDLSTPSGNAANRLFIRRGRLPSDTLFDAASSGTLKANGSVTVASTQDDVYYLLVRGQSEPADNAPIALLAQLLTFGITDVVTDRGGDTRYVTTTISGAQFSPQAIVKLVRPGFAELEPVRYQVIDSTKIIAIFDFRDAPHGL